MNIAFTGHRNRTANVSDLETIQRQFPGATWIHGGAVGFDSQVAAFATAHNIPQIVIRPNYARYGKGAPLIRNREIVDQAHHLVALHDGRKTGGTVYTIRHAQSHSVPVTILSPVQK